MPLMNSFGPLMLLWVDEKGSVRADLDFRVGTASQIRGAGRSEKCRTVIAKNVWCQRGNNGSMSSDVIALSRINDKKMMLNLCVGDTL